MVHLILKLQIDTSFGAVNVEQVAIKLIILFSLFLSFSLPAFYFSTRRVGAGFEIRYVSLTHKNKMIQCVFDPTT